MALTNDEDSALKESLERRLKMFPDRTDGFPKFEELYELAWNDALDWSDRIRSESKGERIYCDRCKGTYWDGATCPHLRARFGPQPSDEEAAEIYSMVKFEGVNKLGHRMYSAEHPKHLEYRELKMNAFLAGIAHERAKGAAEKEVMKNALDTAWRSIMTMDGTSPNVDVDLARKTAEFWERKERLSRINPDAEKGAK